MASRPLGTSMCSGYSSMRYGSIELRSVGDPAGIAVAPGLAGEPIAGAAQVPMALEEEARGAIHPHIAEPSVRQEARDGRGVEVEQMPRRQDDGPPVAVDPCRETP